MGSYSCSIKSVKGVHTVWFTFRGTADESFCMDSFTFE
jgi:hypothetical protein